MTRERSLFLRFFGGFAITMGLVWLGVLAWQATAVQARFDRVQAAETRGWTRQVLAAVRVSATRPDELRDTVRRIEDARRQLFVDNGFARPPWRLEVRRGSALLYASDDEAVPEGVGARGDWTTWTETDPGTGLSVRLSQRPLIAWSFALAGIPRQLAPLLYSFPFLLLPAWLTVRRGLRPVRDLVAQIEARSEHDLAPLAPAGYRELSPLVRSTNHLMSRLAARLQREQEFLADAAHQIKTPLAIIEANAETLAEARDAARRGAARQGLREGVADAVHVTHQLLALARSGAGEGGALRSLDAADLVRRRLAQADGVACPRGIDLEFAGPESCTLSADPEGLVALVDNLVDNAIKHSPPGGTVRVRLQRDDGHVLMRVDDAGPGIPPELRPRVFERFYRVPGQDVAGSGLGLSIVERVALRHQASVSLEDGPGGRGLSVVVRFPVAPPDGA